MARIFKEKNSKRFLFKCYRCSSSQKFVTNSSCSSCTVFERKIHKKDVPFKRCYCCQFCDKKYVKKYALYKHLCGHVSNKFVCQECGEIFDTKHTYKTHKSEHSKRRLYKCNLCKARFIYKRQITLHMKRHNRYYCTKCNQSFASRTRILIHKRRGHPVKGLEPMFLCNFCPKLYNKKESLMRHLQLHKDHQFINCGFCDKNFSTREKYMKHCTTKGHAFKAPIVQKFTCNQCGKSFDKQLKLEMHTKRIHTNKTVKLQCRFCGYETINSTNFNRHLSLHLETKKEFICEKCGKEFSNLDSLNNHISYVHIKTKDYCCVTCGKSFKNNSELNRHQISHSNDRSHQCPQCPSSYKRKIHLTRHLKTIHKIELPVRKVARISTVEDLSKPKKSPLIPDQDQMISIYDEKTGETLTFNLNEFLKDVPVPVPLHHHYPGTSSETVFEFLDDHNDSVTSSLSGLNFAQQSQNYDISLDTLLDYSLNNDVVWRKNQ